MLAEEQPMKRTLVLVGICLWLVTASGRAWGDAFHYNDNLVGERALSMGGAFTALGNEVSGAFYNPAGLVDIDDDYLALSMTIFQFRSREIKSYRTKQDMTRNSLNIIPASAGTIYSFGRHRFGFTIMVPEYDDAIIDFHDTESRPEVHINRSTKSTEYMAGPSLSFFLDRKFSLGATLYGYYRSDKEYVSVLTRLDETFSQSITSSDKTLVGVMPVVGALYKPWPFLSFGLSMRSGLRAFSTAKLNTTVTTNAEGVEPVRFKEEEKENASQFPLMLRGGVAAHIWSGNTTAFDVTFSDPVIYRSAGSNAELLPTVNFNLGIEQLLGALWSVRAGCYTDFTAAPEVDETKPSPPPHIDLFGATLGMGMDGAFTTTTYGINGAYGEGEIFQDGKILEVTEYYIGVFFGGSFRYHTEDEVDALRRWYDIEEEESRPEKKKKRRRLPRLKKKEGE